MDKFDLKVFYQELGSVIDQTSLAKDLSLEELAKKISVHYTTIWRWKGKDYPKRVPQAVGVVQLFQLHTGLSKIEEITAFYKKDGRNSLSKYLDCFFPAAKSNSLENQPFSNLSSIIKDKYDYILFKLAGNQKKYTPRDLCHIVAYNYTIEFLDDELSDESDSSEFKKLHDSFSHVIRKKLNKLISNEVLILESGKVSTGKANILIDFETTMKYLPSSISLFSKTNSNRRSVLTRGYQESIPLDKVIEIENKISKLHKEIFHIMEKSKCENGIPYNYFFTASLFTNEKEEMV